MNRLFGCIILSILCGVYSQSLSNYSVDSSQISVSGLSSGACMAVQYHVAHSKDIMGVGVIAGCGYYCANAKAGLAIECCKGVGNVAEMIAATNYAELTLSIDSTKYIATDKVWLFSGTNDDVVATVAVEKVQQYYSHYLNSESQMFTNYNIPAVHGWVTNGTGAGCSDFGSPFVNNCTYSASGDILEWIYGPLNAPVQAINNNLLTFDQGDYTGILAPSAISMSELGYVYVPSGCQRGQLCKLHVCFHGCEQGYEFVETDFVTENQMNTWAESNNIIILYPQASSTALINPYGCWDWWGYTGLDYATKLASQISAVSSMIDALSQ